MTNPAAFRALIAEDHAAYAATVDAISDTDYEATFTAPRFVLDNTCSHCQPDDICPDTTEPTWDNPAVAASWDQRYHDQIAQFNADVAAGRIPPLPEPVIDDTAEF